MISWVLVASALVFSWKFLGYLVPERLITDKVRAFSERVTVALLAALVSVQALTLSGEWIFDARIPAVAVAGLLLWFRAPFIVVILAAGVVAAGLRALGF